MKNSFDYDEKPNVVFGKKDGSKYLQMIPKSSLAVIGLGLLSSPIGPFMDLSKEEALKIFAKNKKYRFICGFRAVDYEDDAFEYNESVSSEVISSKKDFKECLDESWSYFYRSSRKAAEELNLSGMWLLDFRVEVI